MRILVFLAVGALLTGCASPQPVALESPTQQPTQTEATPEATESVASPETDMPAEEVEEQVDQEVRTESATTEAAPQETTSSAPRATATATPSQTPSPTKTQSTATPTQTPTPTESRLSMSNIAKNNSTASCWVAISGNAYDLTRWIANHQGGPGAISSICGTDATSVFEAKHGGQSQPLSTLDSYILGAVGS
jgi:cytochrome b involved in lipid metabolism